MNQWWEPSRESTVLLLCALLSLATHSHAQDAPSKSTAQQLEEILPREWTQPRGSPPRNIVPLKQYLSHVAITPDGDTLIVADDEPTLMIGWLIADYAVDIVWCLAGLVVIAALIVAVRTIRTPRVRGEPYCRKCNYRLTGAVSPTCPECGADITGRNRVLGPSRRRRWGMILGTIALAGAVSLLAWQLRDQLRKATRSILGSWHSTWLYGLRDEGDGQWASNHLGKRGWVDFYNLRDGSRDRRFKLGVDKRVTNLVVATDGQYLYAEYGWPTQEQDDLVRINLASGAWETLGSTQYELQGEAGAGRLLLMREGLEAMAFDVALRESKPLSRVSEEFVRLVTPAWGAGYAIVEKNLVRVFASVNSAEEPSKIDDAFFMQRYRLSSRHLFVIDRQWRSVRVYDCLTGNYHSSIPLIGEAIELASKQGIYDVLPHPDGRHVIVHAAQWTPSWTSSMTGTGTPAARIEFGVWDLVERRYIRRFDGPFAHYVSEAYLSGDGNTLVLAAAGFPPADGEAWVYDIGAVVKEPRTK